MFIFDEFENFAKRWRRPLEEGPRGGRPRHCYCGFEISVVRVFGGRGGIELGPLTGVIEEGDRAKAAVEMPGVEKEDKVHVSETAQRLPSTPKGGAAKKSGCRPPWIPTGLRPRAETARRARKSREEEGF